MEKWLLYPCNRKHDWMFEYKEEWENIDSLLGMCPCGWRKTIEDNCCIEDANVFEEKLKTVTGVWIVDSDMYLDFEKYILPKIKKAVKENKEIFYTRKTTKKEKQFLEQIPFLERNIIFDDKIEKLPMSTIYDVDVPVFYIVGMTEIINSVEQLVKIKKSFEKLGYNVALFSDAKEVQKIKGGYWLSSYFDTELSHPEKAISANHLIKYIEMITNPDIIIIGVMEGMAVGGRTYVDGFGCSAYSLSRVMRPDCVLLNVMFNKYNEKELNDLGEEIERIIGEKVDFYNVDNKMIDVASSELKEKIQTIRIDEEKLFEVQDICDKEKVYVTICCSECDRLVENIVEKLSNYAEIISM